jgi:adenylate cyclase
MSLSEKTHPSWTSSGARISRVRCAQHVREVSALRHAFASQVSRVIIRATYSICRARVLFTIVNINFSRAHTNVASGMLDQCYLYPDGAKYNVQR